MKFSIIFALLLAVANASDEEQWLQFKKDHGKSYRSLAEEKLRYGIFQDTLRLIEQHNERFNNEETSYMMGVNQFSDLTQEEFESLLTLTPPVDVEVDEALQDEDIGDLPATVDWRDKGAVTDVRNQGKPHSCGSCWAFSAVSSLEGQVAIHLNRLEVLSPQNLLDCATKKDGCKGGDMLDAFFYIYHHGINTEKEYPYEAKQGKCRQKGEGLHISDFASIRSGHEDRLLSAIANVGPISVAIDASSLKNYKSGVLDNSSGCHNQIHYLNHGVTAVGYDEESIIIKNSWGVEWGDKGYLRLKKNENTCGVALHSSYPIL